MDRDLSIIGQNAGTTAAAIYNALVAQRGDVTFDVEEYRAIRQAVFEGTLELAGTAQVVATFDEGPGPTTPVRTAPAGNTRPFSRGSGGGGGQGDHGAGIEINFGKHKGKTIGQLAESEPSYLEWLAENSNNDFIRSKVQEFLANAA